MLVYWGDRSFKMTSNSDKLLAGKGTEETLAVVDKDILIESNDLETEFTAKVSKTPDIHSESCFWASIVDKRLKKKRLNRHQWAEHGEYTKTNKDGLPLDAFKQFVSKCKGKLAKLSMFWKYYRRVVSICN